MGEAERPQPRPQKSKRPSDNWLPGRVSRASIWKTLSVEFDIERLWDGFKGTDIERLWDGFEGPGMEFVRELPAVRHLVQAAFHRIVVRAVWRENPTDYSHPEDAFVDLGFEYLKAKRIAQGDRHLAHDVFDWIHLTHPPTTLDYGEWEDTITSVEQLIEDIADAATPDEARFLRPGLRFGQPADRARTGVAGGRQSGGRPPTRLVTMNDISATPDNSTGPDGDHDASQQADPVAERLVARTTAWLRRLPDGPRAVHVAAHRLHGDIADVEGVIDGDTAEMELLLPNTAPSNNWSGWQRPDDLPVLLTVGDEDAGLPRKGQALRALPARDGRLHVVVSELNLVWTGADPADGPDSWYWARPEPADEARWQKLMHLDGRDVADRAWHRGRSS